MRALRFDQFGEPGVLRVEELPNPAARNNDAVISVKAASVNPADVKNVAGTMEGTLLPRVPGRDFAGTVVEGSPEWIGVDAWGTGGDVGFTRDGTHAELLAVPEAALVRKPGPLSFAEASVIGVNFVVGWVVYDAVGGVTTPAALASLRRRGRLAVISAIGTRTAEVDLINLYRNETRIFGVDSRKLDVVESGKRLGTLSSYFESGRFRPLPIARRYSLADGEDAYRAVAQGTRGRVVIEET